MIRNMYISDTGVLRNALNRSAEVDVLLGISQGAMVTLDVATGKVTLPADIAAAQAAAHVVINADSGKHQYDSYVENYTGTELKFPNGDLVRIYDLGTLTGNGIAALSVSEAIVVTPDAVAAGDVLIPGLDGTWAEGVITGYAYYLKVLEIVEDERGNVFRCQVVQA